MKPFLFTKCKLGEYSMEDAKSITKDWSFKTNTDDLCNGMIEIGEHNLYNNMFILCGSKKKK